MTNQRSEKETCAKYFRKTIQKNLVKQFSRYSRVPDPFPISLKIQFLFKYHDRQSLSEAAGHLIRNTPCITNPAFGMDKRKREIFPIDNFLFNFKEISRKDLNENYLNRKS